MIALRKIKFEAKKKRNEKAASWASAGRKAVRNIRIQDQPDRWASLYSVLDVIEVCPVAFEIYERLKKEYGWRYRR